LFQGISLLAFIYKEPLGLKSPTQENYWLEQNLFIKSKYTVDACRFLEVVLIMYCPIEGKIKTYTLRQGAFLEWMAFFL
jgi:hypothetical protein